MQPYRGCLFLIASRKLYARMDYLNTFSDLNPPLWSRVALQRSTYVRDRALRQTGSGPARPCTLPADGDLLYAYSDTRGCSDGMPAPVSCITANATFAGKRPDGDRLLTLLPFMILCFATRLRWRRAGFSPHGLVTRSILSALLRPRK